MLTINNHYTITTNATIYQTYCNECHSLNDTVGLQLGNER